jgi:hypothetical protein
MGFQKEFPTCNLHTLKKFFCHRDLDDEETFPKELRTWKK